MDVGSVLSLEKWLYTLSGLRGSSRSSHVFFSFAKGIRFRKLLHHQRTTMSLLLTTPKS